MLLYLFPERPAHGCHAAVPRHRDGGRRHVDHHQAQHARAVHQEVDVHHRRGLPDSGGLGAELEVSMFFIESVENRCFLESSGNFSHLHTLKKNNH